MEFGTAADPATEFLRQLLQAESKCRLIAVLVFRVLRFELRVGLPRDEHGKTLARSQYLSRLISGVSKSWKRTRSNNFPFRWNPESAESNPRYATIAGRAQIDVGSGSKRRRGCGRIASATGGRTSVPGQSAWRSGRGRTPAGRQRSFTLALAMGREQFAVTASPHTP